MAIDYRVSQQWRTGAFYYDATGGTYQEKTICGTSYAGGPRVRWLIGAEIYSNQMADFVVTNGTEFIFQLRDLAAGHYSIKPGVYPRSSVGTNLMIQYNSPNGTVSLNLFYE